MRGDEETRCECARLRIMQIEQIPWWQSATIYQVYPRSFQDTDGDGVGDLRGITSRLPYLAELGVDAIWLSPIFRSPMKDFGYDISNYLDVDPLFGTMSDFDTLLEAAHKQDLRLLLDFVPNHTSDQHPWFVESRSSRRSPKRDWYLWHDPAPDGGPPNNWLSEFGGSAWQFDNATGQYYYHAFLSEQPDLNWRNPDVVRAMHEVMRFWLRKGVDGFRVDVIWHLIKDAQFRDNPVNPHYTADKPPSQNLVPQYTTDLPEVHGVIRGLRRLSTNFQNGSSSAKSTCRSIGWLPTTGVTLKKFICRSIFRCSRRGGMRAKSPNLLIATRLRSQKAAGQIGCLAITIAPELPPGSAQRRRESRPCCC